MNINIIKFKADYFKQIKTYNFNTSHNLLRDHLDHIIKKYSNDQNIISALYNYRNVMNQLSLFQTDKLRFYRDIEAYLINLNDEYVFMDLLSFFDDNFMYNQNIQNLTELTCRQTLLIQENLKLSDKLELAINKITNLQISLEQLININLTQNNTLLTIEENTTIEGNTTIKKNLTQLFN